MPDHFARESGLGVGQKFEVIQVGPRRTGGAVVRYEIAGVVSIPGWHWMTKTGFRQGRSAGLMFCEREMVRRGIQHRPHHHLLGNLDGTATEDEIKESVQAALGRTPPTRPGGGQPGPGGGGRPGPGGGGGGVTVKSAEGVRKEIRGRADGIIWTLSELPPLPCWSRRSAC